MDENTGVFIQWNIQAWESITAAQNNIDESHIYTIGLKEMLKHKLRHIKIFQEFISAYTNWNQAAPDQKWLGVLHPQEQGNRFL